MKIEKTNLDGVLLIEPKPFEDFRGSYVETWNKQAYEEAGIDAEFVQDDVSMSRQHVLRGIHGDSETCKLVTCLEGSFYLIVVKLIQSAQSFEYCEKRFWSYGTARMNGETSWLE